MIEILSLNFMQNALVAGLLVSAICGISGSLIVVNRMSFIAGGIAHGAYGGIGAAFFLGVDPLLGAGVFSLFLALIIATVTLKDRARMDSVIGAIWAFGMAAGIIFIDLTPGYSGDLMSYLFGSILAVSGADLAFMATLGVAFLAAIAVFYRQFAAVSFDAEFARLRGVRTTLFYYALVCMTALILVIALLTIPPFIAQIFAKRLGSMMAISAALSAIFCLAGLFVSFWLNLTSGASIILIASVCFFAFAFKFRRF